MPNFPSLQEWSDFINAQKNIAVAFLFIIIAAYVTIVPGVVVSEYASQWVAAAMAISGIYVGHRIEGGKTEATIAAVAAVAVEKTQAAQMVQLDQRM